MAATTRLVQQRIPPPTLDAERRPLYFRWAGQRFRVTAVLILAGRGRLVGGRYFAAGGVPAVVPLPTVPLQGRQAQHLHASSGTPVLLLHGLSGGCRSWQQTLPGLA